MALAANLLQTKRKTLLFFEQHLPELQTCRLRSGQEHYTDVQFAILRQLVRQMHLDGKRQRQVVNDYLLSRHGYTVDWDAQTADTADEQQKQDTAIEEKKHAEPAKPEQKKIDFESPELVYQSPNIKQSKRHVDTGTHHKAVDTSPVKANTHHEDTQKKKAEHDDVIIPLIQAQPPMDAAVPVIQAQVDFSDDATIFKKLSILESLVAQDRIRKAYSDVDNIADIIRPLQRNTGA